MTTQDYVVSAQDSWARHLQQAKCPAARRQLKTPFGEQAETLLCPFLKGLGAHVLEEVYGGAIVGTCFYLTAGSWFTVISR